ncbi:hypothetical protein KUCAC02_005676 [Chaenocephalus aceratus]|uniref:Uncharacterized protein n=1 Tax=Chaenocephalus aceratus TaxID=36190 RepID=A0ACB9WQS8_CHAAC|nr:hypothetical protein KUCAC02_005676 [Chaenocephalus aceratus]
MPDGLKEVQFFLQDKNVPLSDMFDDTVWLSQLAYLSDIFSRLNDLNLGLQGLSINVFDVQDKINTMLKKLELFEIKVKADIKGLCSRRQAQPSH